MGTRTVTASIAKSSTLFTNTNMSSGTSTTKNFTFTLNPNSNEYIKSLSIAASDVTLVKRNNGGAGLDGAAPLKFTIKTTLTTTPITSGQSTQTFYTNTTAEYTTAIPKGSTTATYSWPAQSTYSVTNANIYKTKYSNVNCTTVATDARSVGTLAFLYSASTAAARTFTFTLVTASTLTISNPASGGTAKATRSDSTNITTSNDVIYQDSVTLSATPAAHYQFSGWQSSPEVTITSNTFTMPDSNVTITPVFEYIAHDITIASAQHGSATTSSAIGDAGETITLTATPDYGYRLNHWESSPEVTFTGNTFVMPNSDITITPVFEKYMFDVTIGQASHGSATASTAIADIGDTVTLTATPDYGYRLSHWTSVPEVTFTGDTFIMPSSDITVTPVFERYIFDITIATVQHGYATASQSEAAIGTVITLQDFPDTYYRFIGWESVPQVAFTGNTFVMPNSDITVTPIFIDRAGYYNGSNFIPCVPMYYDGTNWIECEWKYYDGTNWIDADST